MTDTQVSPQPGAQPDTTVPTAAPSVRYDAAQQYGAPPVEPPARRSWFRRRWVRITAISVAALIALGGAFGAGTLVGRSLGVAGAPAGFSEGELPQGGPGGMTPPDGIGGGGFGQAPGSSTDQGTTGDDGTTSDGTTSGFGA